MNPVTTAIAVTRCRACGGQRLEPVLDLGDQPACDHFPPADDAGPDPRWPLALVLCADCTLLQLSHDSPAPEEPRAVESATLQRHAHAVVQRLLDRLPETGSATVREFSSHHGGSWLAALQGAGCQVVSDDTARVVIDNHSIIHAEDLAGELAERAEAVAGDGYLVIEFHHALAQLVQAQFDTVRHGHPLYFSLHSWQAACGRAGFSLVDAWREDVFGGCLVVVARRGDHPASAEAESILAEEVSAGATTSSGYTEFAERAATISSDLRTHLEQAHQAGRRVVAYGAGSKACTLLSVAGIDPGLLPLVADLSPAKHGRRIPGAGIPIVSPEDLVASAPDEVLILTWDIAPEVVAQLQGLGLRDAEFWVPMPYLSALSS